MIRSKLVIAGGLLSSVLWGQPALAASDAFQTACNTVVKDIQDDRRVCLIGVVESEKVVRVLFATDVQTTFRRVTIYKSSIADPAELPIDGLSAMKGQTVAIGGLSNGPDTLYSARLLPAGAQ